MPIRQIWCLFGLAFVAIGSGFFLPAITPLFGEICKDNCKIKQETSFTAYYLAKNIGALLSPVISGYIATRISYHDAFIMNGLAMFSGAIIFYLGSHHFSQVAGFYRKNKANLFIVVGLTLLAPIIAIIIHDKLDGILLLLASILTMSYLFLILRKQDHQIKINFILIFVLLFIMFFYLIALGQGGTTLNLFIDRITNRVILGHQIPTAVYYALDPLFMLSIGPIVLYFVAKLAKKLNSELTYPKTFSAIGILGLAYGIFYLAAKIASHYGHSSSLFIVFAYLLFPITELLLFPTILAFIYKRAPKELISTTMGVYLLAQAIAAYGMGYVSNFGKINFKLLNLGDLKHAAVIYQHFFLILMTGLISFSLFLLFSYYVRRSVE